MKSSIPAGRGGVLPALDNGLVELLWGVGGLLLGLTVGTLTTWYVMHRQAVGLPAPASRRAAAPVAPAQDSEVRRVLDANRRTLEELEDRYRDRKPPRGKG